MALKAAPLVTRRWVVSMARTDAVCLMPRSRDTSPTYSPAPKIAIGISSPQGRLAVLTGGGGG